MISVRADTIDSRGGCGVHYGDRARDKGEMKTGHLLLLERASGSLMAKEKVTVRGFEKGCKIFRGLIWITVQFGG